MNITDVRIKKVKSDTKNVLKATAAVTFDEVFVVHDVKVLEGEKGLFIAFPSRKSKDGSFMDIAHPISTECRNEIQDAVLKAYAEVE